MLAIFHSFWYIAPIHYILNLLLAFVLIFLNSCLLSLTLQSYESSECIALGSMEDLCYKDGW
jgi:hypothetical protein